MEAIEGSETSAYNYQTPGKHPKEYIIYIYIYILYIPLHVNIFLLFLNPPKHQPRSEKSYVHDLTTLFDAGKLSEEHPLFILFEKLHLEVYVGAWISQGLSIIKAYFSPFPPLSFLSLYFSLLSYRLIS